MFEVMTAAHKLTMEPPPTDQERWSFVLADSNPSYTHVYARWSSATHLLGYTDMHMILVHAMDALPGTRSAAVMKLYRKAEQLICQLALLNADNIDTELGKTLCQKEVTSTTTE
jgi:hypothetical protein